MSQQFKKYLLVKPNGKIIGEYNDKEEFDAAITWNDVLEEFNHEIKTPVLAKKVAACNKLNTRSDYKENNTKKCKTIDKDYIQKHIVWFTLDLLYRNNFKVVKFSKVQYLKNFYEKQIF